MAAMSNYLENAMLDHILGTSSFTMPSTVYIGLFLSDPGDDASGTEVSGSGYAREAITFAAASDGEAANDAAVNFAATGDWGEVTHWALFDNVSGGNMLVYAAFDVSREILEDDEVTLRIGDIKVTAD